MKNWKHHTGIGVNVYTPQVDSQVICGYEVFPVAVARYGVDVICMGITIALFGKSRDRIVGNRNLWYDQVLYGYRDSTCPLTGGNIHGRDCFDLFVTDFPALYGFICV